MDQTVEDRKKQTRKAPEEIEADWRPINSRDRLQDHEERGMEAAAGAARPQRDLDAQITEANSTNQAIVTNNANRTQRDKLETDVDAIKTELKTLEEECADAEAGHRHRP